jgi:hypothetical protein
VEFGFGRLEKERAQIGITQASETELAATDGQEQLIIGLG